jgi:hypothetical protein
MGFQSIHGFNLAMFGKQDWKMLTNPDAIVTKKFKAKYFPNENFLGASWDIILVMCGVAFDHPELC